LSETLTSNPIAILLLFAAFSLVPLFVATMTGFLKISVVMFLVRNALGIQQTPPNLALYAIALVLTLYISAPMLGEAYGRLTEKPIDLNSVEGIKTAINKAKGPLQEHLSRFTSPKERQFFVAATSRIWPESARAEVSENDFVILLPAFISSELTRAFEIGFLIYLPFLVIDLIVSITLIAMGMIFVPPTLISVPLKLLLFVAVDGWARLLHGLILTYG
jgi:type III secretion protein R